MKSYNFQDRLNRLISLDNIRLLKFAEIFQYCILYIIFVFIITYIIDKTYFDIIKIDLLKEKSLLHFIEILILVIFETFILTLILFYIRKIVLLFPSIGTIYNKKFIPHTTIEYTMHIALIYVFFELLPKFKDRFNILITYF